MQPKKYKRKGLAKCLPSITRQSKGFTLQPEFTKHFVPKNNEPTSKQIIHE
jgi:hypothetical protein